MRGVAAFFMVIGALGLLFNGLFRLFDWAEAYSRRKDEKVEAAYAQFDDDEPDVHEVFYRKLMPLWTISFALGGFAYLVLVLTDW